MSLFVRYPVPAPTHSQVRTVPQTFLPVGEPPPPPTIYGLVYVSNFTNAFETDGPMNSTPRLNATSSTFTRQTVTGFYGGVALRGSGAAGDHRALSFDVLDGFQDVRIHARFKVTTATNIMAYLIARGSGTSDATCGGYSIFHLDSTITGTVDLIRLSKKLNGSEVATADSGTFALPTSGDILQAILQVKQTGAGEATVRVWVWVDGDTPLDPDVDTPTVEMVDSSSPLSGTWHGVHASYDSGTVLDFDWVRAYELTAAVDISALDQLVSEFGWSMASGDTTMTLRHLMAMISTYGFPNESAGAVYAYSNAGAGLLAATLNRSSGGWINDQAVALFAPLGLEDLESVTGIGDVIFSDFDAVGVQLSPRDFARIGLLWLNRGDWDGTQVIPASFFAPLDEIGDVGSKFGHIQVPNTIPRTSDTFTGDYLKVTPFAGPSGPAGMDGAVGMGSFGMMLIQNGDAPTPITRITLDFKNRGAYFNDSDIWPATVGPDGDVRVLGSDGEWAGGNTTSFDLVVLDAADPPDAIDVGSGTVVNQKNNVFGAGITYRDASTMVIWEQDRSDGGRGRIGTSTDNGANFSYLVDPTTGWTYDRTDNLGGAAKFVMSWEKYDANYMYATVEGPSTGVYLLRIPVAEDPRDATKHEWFTGSVATPAWTAGSSGADAAVEISGIASQLDTSMFYNNVLDRFILTVSYINGSADVEMYESPTPWGAFTRVFGPAKLPGGPTTYSLAFQFVDHPDWFAADGRSCWGIYSGGPGPVIDWDGFYTMKATFWTGAARYETDFSGGDENPISEGGAWNTPGTFSDLKIASAIVQPAATGGATREAILTSTGWATVPDDHWSEAATTRLDHQVGVCVRVQSNGACYMLVTENSTSVALYHVSSADAYTQIGSTTAAVTAWAAGDVLRLEVEGTTLRGYVNGVLVMEETDATLSSGRPGINAVALTDINDTKILTFAAGDLIVSPLGPPSQWPDCPADMYATTGLFGQQSVVVIPSLGLVIACQSTLAPGNMDLMLGDQMVPDATDPQWNDTFAALFAGISGPGLTPVFPGVSWSTCTDGQAEMSTASLDAFVSAASPGGETNWGVIVRNGYIVRTWGGNALSDWSSSAKAILATLVGAFVPAGATTFPASMSGSLSSAGALLRQMGSHPAGTLTSIGAVIQQASKGLAGTLTSIGAVIRQASKGLAGTLTSSGAITRSASASYAGSISSSGVTAKQVQRSFDGALSSAGALARAVLQVVSGMVAGAGVLTRQVNQLLSGTLGLAGALAKQASMALAGVLNAAGTLGAIRIILLAIGGTLSAAGVLIRQANATVAGVLSSGGMLVKQVMTLLVGVLTGAGAVSVIRTILLGIAGTLSGAGSMTKQVATSATGVVAIAGVLLRQPATAFSAAIAIAGVLAKQPATMFAGALSTAGATAKSVAQLLAGTLATSGSLAKLAIRIMAGVLGLAGSLATLASGGLVYIIPQARDKADAFRSWRSDAPARRWKSDAHRNWKSDAD